MDGGPTISLTCGGSLFPRTRIRRNLKLRMNERNLTDSQPELQAHIYFSFA
jgi:hypothetical protein